MSLSLIEEANTAVVSAHQKEATTGTRGPYLKLSNKMTKDWFKHRYTHGSHKHGTYFP